MDSTGADNIIDRVALSRLLVAIGGEREDLAELIQDFVSGAPKLVRQLCDSGAQADWPATRIAAHTLKSDSRNFGATELAALCKVLEDQCKAGDVSEFESIAAQIVKAEAIARRCLLDIDANDVPSA